MTWLDFSIASTAIFLAIPAAIAGTTTTSYTYNPDGALTSVEEVDGADTSTKTLYIWDNFSPAAWSAPLRVDRITRRF